MDHVAVAESTRGLASILRSLQTGLRERGVKSVHIFGSRARADARPDSDLDLLIEIEPGRRFTLINLVALEEWLSESVHLRVHVTTWGAVPEDERSEVERDAVPVL